MRRYHTILISDLHLGSGQCNVAVLLVFLRSVLYHRLIIVGDLIENGATLSDQEMEVIEYFRENRERITIIDGNHDPVEQGMVKALLGIKVVKKYRWKIRGKEFCALHGHQFHVTSFIFKSWIIDKLFGWTVWFAKKCYGLSHLVTFLHDKFSWSIARKVIEYAKKRKKLRKQKKQRRFEESDKKEIKIFCGHTHKVLHLVSYHKDKRIVYINLGGFLIGDPCSFGGIDFDGNATVHLIDQSGCTHEPVEAQLL